MNEQWQRARMNTEHISGRYYTTFPAQHIIFPVMTMFSPQLGCIFDAYKCMYSLGLGAPLNLFTLHETRI